MSKLKETIKNNKLLYPAAKAVVNKYKLLVFKHRGRVFTAEQKRVIAGKSHRYDRLRALKDTANGKRCFIVATGPSLTVEDLCALKNEITFGVNSLIKWFPKTGWETTYFGIQDLNTYKALEKDILSLKSSVILYSMSGQAGNAAAKKLAISGKNNAVEFPLHYRDHLYNRFRYNTEFSDNALLAVYDGYTVVYSMLQLAVFMGYKDIYLIGTDCNYTLPKKNIIDIGVQNSNWDILGERMIFSYNIARQYADKHGINIYNATRGGMLEVFPRVDTDEILRTAGTDKP